MRRFRHDVRFGLRVLKNSPGFTLVAVLTLALGIAVNTTVFSWLDSILLHPLPGVANPGSLAFLETVTSGGEYLVNNSYIDYRDYRDNLKLVSGLAIARNTPLSLGADGKAQRAWGELVSGNFFDVLGVKPILGRAFLPQESGNQPGAYPVAVISYRMWQKQFQGDQRVLGKVIRLNRHPITIVGVAPQGFRGTVVGLSYDVWMPITMATAMGTGDGTLTYRATRDITTTIARLKPGVSVEQARAEVAALAARLDAAYPRTNRGIGASLMLIADGHNGAQGLLRAPLRILMAFCLLLLLIVCANVANLLLSRAVSRHREFGIRLALGSGRWPLVQQLLTETLMLAGAGAVTGAIMSLWMTSSLGLLLPPNDFPLALETTLSAPTLLFTLLLAVAATVISGTAPALLTVRANLNDALKEGGRTGGAGTHTHRLRSLLVVAEVALASVALIGAGLFFRSFRNASAIHPGFDMTNVSVSQFFLSSSGYTAEEQRAFCRNLRERMERVPGVKGVSYSDVIPMGFGASPWHQLQIEGYTPGSGEDMHIHRALVPPSYFELMHIPLLEGRDFTERDDERAMQAMVVNETFVRRYFGGRSPLGRKVKFDSRTATIVGVVKDAKYRNPAESAVPYFYLPFRQVFAPGLNFAFFVKTAGDPMRVVEALRREALSLNQDATFKTSRLADAATAGVYPQKVAATLLSVVGVISLLLAAIGLYSVMSYAVSQRTQELGIRMALGARPADVLAMVVRQGLALAVPGLFAGAAAALAASRFLGGMLVEVRATDPATFAATIAFLGAVAAAASYVPAWRATRIAPMAALRCQ